MFFGVHVSVCLSVLLITQKIIFMTFLWIGSDKNEEVVNFGERSESYNKNIQKAHFP